MIPGDRGAKGPLPFLTPNGQKVAGALDAAGQAFWFNGQRDLRFNPLAVAAATVRQEGDVQRQEAASSAACRWPPSRSP